MRTAAVLTGASTRADIGQMTSPPDFVLESVAALPDALATWIDGAAGHL